MSKITPLLPLRTALICVAILTLRTTPGEAQSMTGWPVVVNSSSADVPSDLWLDASQFSGADMCAQINTAYTTALPTSGGVIDARVFNGLQPCNSNPFHNANIPVVLLLGAAQVITSVPWWTPQAGGGIIGVTPAPGTNSVGTSITACGPSNVPSGMNWSGSPNNTCTINETTIVHEFPHSTTTLTFNFQHGPFSASSYPATFACIICLGGQGSSEGAGWNYDGTNGMFVINVKVDLGGVANTFGIYSQNAEERSILDGDSFAHWSSNGGYDDNDAAVFYDRAEAPTKQSGPAHFAFGNLSGNTNQTTNSSSSYGLVYEGSDATCIMSGGNGSGASCYVTKVSAGGTPTVAVGYAGTGYTTAPTWTVYGAPCEYPGTTVAGCGTDADITDCYGTATISGGAVSTMGTQCSATDYNSGFIGTGPESLHATFTGTNSGTMTGGVLLDGMENAQVDYLHNEYNSGYALQLGTGNNYYQSGFFKGIDVDSTVAGGVVHLLPGGDTTQNLFNLQYTSGSGTIIWDESLGPAFTGASARSITSAEGVQSGSSKILPEYSPLGPYLWVAPTISSGFGTSPSVPNGKSTVSFTINVGTGGTASSGVIAFPLAPDGWQVSCNDVTTKIGPLQQTGTTTTTATITQYNFSGTATAWSASDILQCKATAY
jgi:hypothetical protein